VADKEIARDLPTYPIQLVEAYLYEATIERLEREAASSDEPRLLTRIMATAEDTAAKQLKVLLEAEVLVPFRPEAELRLVASVTGVFSWSGRQSKSARKGFLEREAVVLLWPYLRAHVTQLSALTAVKVPNLPTLDVIALLALMRADSEQEKREPGSASGTLRASSHRRDRAVPEPTRQLTGHTTPG
jgi:preprotein translocase subunit SecB